MTYLLMYLVGVLKFIKVINRTPETAPYWTYTAIHKPSSFGRLGRAQCLRIGRIIVRIM